MLWRAQLSPVTWTARLSADDIAKLYEAMRTTLNEWTEKLRRETIASKDGFPDKVTAFREDLAVHGRYRKPCPRCGKAVMRIRYVDNETNYCPTCQTGGKLLADRALHATVNGVSAGVRSAAHGHRTTVDRAWLSRRTNREARDRSA